MRLPRQHEQRQACRPTDPGRQASPARPRRGGPRSLTAAALAAAFLSSGTAPALAQHAQPAPAAPGAGAPARVHQAALPSSTVEKAISAAESKKGTPYGWGGTGPDSFDCSGLVQWSFAQAGVDLPRVAHDQVREGTRVSYSDARRGDILYWADGGGYAYHVAIYLGGGRMIDAPKSGDQVRERDVNRYNLAGAVRL
ncbi:C40 family peptidase [Nocardiopsis tropica]|uniref:C40 family peptidase n=1 Tax=Nocardiopsis tropica TaxID=109330 RepID=A0ABU7KPM6_9ACTN|nr:C40 family peptidase [Nocardiopsis umidischolae]MEE2051233.1 C40 family peptidase [Nocardiopsis umidischolae]